MVIEKPKLDQVKEKLEKLQVDLFCALSLLNEIYLNVEKEKSAGKIALLSKFDDKNKDK